MKVTLIPAREFARQFKRLAKKYKSLGEDYKTLKKELMENPFQGDDLGGGVRKIRMVSVGSLARYESKTCIFYFP